MCHLQGIVPTLIVVRISLGISTQDAQTVILASGIQFDHRETSGTQSGTV